MKFFNDPEFLTTRYSEFYRVDGGDTLDVSKLRSFLQAQLHRFINLQFRYSQFYFDFLDVEHSFVHMSKNFSFENWHRFERAFLVSYDQVLPVLYFTDSQVGVPSNDLSFTVFSQMYFLYVFDCLLKSDLLKDLKIDFSDMNLDSILAGIGFELHPDVMVASSFDLADMLLSSIS